MRVFTDVDEKHGRVVVTYSESIILHDVMEMMFTSEKARVLDLPTLIDARNAPLRLSSEDLIEILRAEKELSKRHKINKCAILVSSVEELQKASEVALYLLHIAPMQAFTDRDKAERWLGWKK